MEHGVGQSEFSFVVWACPHGVVSLRSGPFTMQLAPQQARDLGVAMQRAAEALLASDRAAECESPAASARTYDFAAHRAARRVED